MYRTFYAWKNDAGNLVVVMYSSDNPADGQINLVLDKKAVKDMLTGLSNAYEWAKEAEDVQCETLLDS